MNGKTIACKDFGMTCPFSVTSEDGQEAIDLAMTHLKNKHADKLNSMSDEEREASVKKMEEMVGI